MIAGKMPSKRNCSGCVDSALPAKMPATADSQLKTTAKVLPLQKDTEVLASAACQPSSSSSAHISNSSSSASSSEDENEDDMEPSTMSHSATLLAIVKEKPTMLDMVMKNVESLFRLLDK